MSYSRFAIGFSRHRKVSRLSDAAFRLWASAIDYSREQLTGGELDQFDLDALPRVPVGRKRSETIAELVVDGAFVIHDFDDVARLQVARRVRKRIQATSQEIEFALEECLTP